MTSAWTSRTSWETAFASTSSSPKVALWVASAVVRRVELWGDALVLPPDLAARAAVLAFGNELLDLQLPDRNDLWRSPVP
jgi:hypothetical protein